MTVPTPDPETILVLREQLPMRSPYVAPRNLTEDRLAKIWRTVLSMDRVGVDDHYQDLGGDSFHATIIFSLIEEDFGIILPMAVLATASTVAAMAVEIDRLAPVQP